MLTTNQIKYLNDLADAYPDDRITELSSYYSMDGRKRDSNGQVLPLTDADKTSMTSIKVYMHREYHYLISEYCRINGISVSEFVRLTLAASLAAELECYRSN